MDERELEQRVKELKAEVKNKQAEEDVLEARLREELLPQLREVVAYGRKRGHTWMDQPIPFLGPHDDEKLIEYLVELFSARSLGHIADELGDLKDDLRKAQKELKRKRELREWLGSSS